MFHFIVKSTCLLALAIAIWYFLDPLINELNGAAREFREQTQEQKELREQFDGLDTDPDRLY